jgi:hypothetical protein
MDVTPEMISEGLKRELGIQLREVFEPRSEEHWQAIEMVNKDDLLGAIQAMESLAWARMEKDPSFYQKYLEAVRQASQGNAAGVAEFVNSLGAA